MKKTETRQEPAVQKEVWRPTYKWFAITAGAILMLLTASFFILNIVLKPHMREMPPAITPWLNNGK